MRTRIAIMVLAIVVLAVAATGAFAMSSSNYHMDWWSMSTSSGGGHLDSTNYEANVTLGQSFAVNALTSGNYKTSLGLWIENWFRVMEPVVFRNN